MVRCQKQHPSRLVLAISLAAASGFVGCGGLAAQLGVCCSAVDERAWRHQQLARSLQTGGAASGDADFQLALQLALEDEAEAAPARGQNCASVHAKLNSTDTVSP